MPEQGAQFRREEKAAAEARQGKNMAARRRQWEKKNPDRMRTAAEGGMPVGQVYHARGWGEAKVGPMMGERQLPGLEDPLAAAQPPRWEDLAPEEQKKAQRGLRRTAGASLDSMANAFGAQLDQSYERAQRHAPKGEPGVPYSQNFYTEGEPAQVMKASAKKLGVPYGVSVAASAFTSPNTKFKQGDRYPNLETAESVIRQHQAGVPTEKVTTGTREGDPTKKNQGYHQNARRAAHGLDQYDKGVPLREWKTPAGAPMHGPKTGPYHNSWLESTPDFFVSDVHSGGGGMLPHLSSDKPVRRDETGAAVVRGGREMRLKSERESAIERTPHFHAMADKAARTAMEARGLGRVRQAQAAQWGEEQIRRTVQNPRTAMAKESDVYPKVGQQFRQIPGQGKLL